MQMQFESQLNTQNKLYPKSNQEMFYEISAIIVNSENDISQAHSSTLRESPEALSLDYPIATTTELGNAVASV